MPLWLFGFLYYWYLLTLHPGIPLPDAPDLVLIGRLGIVGLQGGPVIIYKAGSGTSHNKGMFALFFMLYMQIIALFFLHYLMIYTLYFLHIVYICLICDNGPNK